ncbi:MAG TPA: VirB8/TrbF family protein [Bryobacteraceae bacterium]|jgi:type IV secretory pathway TrbF-like protein|nr:VirB8/TrbF family protein [Bryobacteraceae bacterium]
MSEMTNLMPPPDADLAAARRQFVELYATPLIAGNYLRIGLACVSVVALGLVVLSIKTFQAFHNFRPLVIRINDVGRAEAVAYESLTYQPRDAEVRYFLIEFVTKHYSRMRATVRENFARSLYFLDGRLADATIEANKKNRTLESFLTGDGAQIEVAVKNVAIEDMRTPPYKATVDFERVYYNNGDSAELKREKYTAHFVFVVKDVIPNAMIPVNPLGLTITYFREDQAFQ